MTPLPPVSATGCCREKSMSPKYPAKPLPEGSSTNAPPSQRHWLLQGEECTLPLQRGQCDFVTLRGSIHRGVSQGPKRDWRVRIQGYSRILWDIKKPLIRKGESHEAPRALHQLPNFILIVLLPHAGDLGKVWRPAASYCPPFSVKEV